MNDHITWVDNAKALGIILVMLGHTRGEFGHSLFVYSFHMPLFFFLSGYLLSRDTLRLPFSAFIQKIGSKTVTPYCWFWYISYVWWIMRPTKGVGPFDPIFGFCYGISRYLWPNVALWFLTCLFCVFVIFYLCHRFIDRRFLLPFVAALSLVAAYILNDRQQMRLPWNIDTALVAVLFMALGHECRSHQVAEKITRGRIANIVGFLGCGIGLYFLADYNGLVLLSGSIYRNPITFFTTGILGILMIIYASNLIPRNKSCEWLSRNTLPLFTLHQLFYSVFTGIGMLVFKLPRDFNTHPVIYLSYVALAVVLAIPSSVIIRRYFPWAIGAQENHAALRLRTNDRGCSPA